MAKFRRRTRNLITVFLSGAAALFFVVYFLEIPSRDVLYFFLSVLLFVLGLILLAALAIALVKGVGKFFRR